ncbi:hypothetical protein ACLD0U_09815 [Microbacterium sp. 2216-1]|uniref:hypothetical protein n=1 Tax=Microbacterium sp. 2216-1 TaxID=3390053 RepID=UPI003975755C
MAERKITGSIRCCLSGGPLDGARYGDVPNPGHAVKGARLSIPLSQPAETAAHAVYICPAPGSPDDTWEFLYAKTVYPGLPVGTKASFL